MLLCRVTVLRTMTEYMFIFVIKYHDSMGYGQIVERFWGGYRPLPLPYTFTNKNVQMHKCTHTSNVMASLP